MDTKETIIADNGELEVRVTIAISNRSALITNDGNIVGLRDCLSQAVVKHLHKTGPGLPTFHPRQLRFEQPKATATNTKEPLRI